MHEAKILELADVVGGSVVVVLVSSSVGNIVVSKGTVGMQACVRIAQSIIAIGRIIQNIETKTFRESQRIIQRSQTLTKSVASTHLSVVLSRIYGLHVAGFNEKRRREPTGKPAGRALPNKNEI